MNTIDLIKLLISDYERRLPPTVYLVRNGERYQQVIDAMQAIQRFISSVEEDARFEIVKEELIGTTLSLEVKCSVLCMTEVDKFCSAIKKADSIDIVPLSNGTLEVIFSFKNAYTTAPTR